MVESIDKEKVSKTLVRYKKHSETALSSQKKAIPLLKTSFPVSPLWTEEGLAAIVGGSHSLIADRANQYSALTPLVILRVRFPDKGSSLFDIDLYGPEWDGWISLVYS